MRRRFHHHRRFRRHWHYPPPEPKKRFPSNKKIIFFLFIAVIVYLVLFAPQDTLSNISASLQKSFAEIRNATSNSLFMSAFFEKKDTYYCTESNSSTCIPFVNQLKNNCNTSVIIEDFTLLKAKTDISRKDSCYVSISVERSAMPQFEGTSMSCVLPVEKANLLTDINIMNLLSYCSGSFKTAYYNAASQMFGSFFG